jgi:hypothetical protein
MVSEFRSMAEEQGLETFEEADDFEFPDDDEEDLTSPYTVKDLRPEVEYPESLDGTEPISADANKVDTENPDQENAVPPSSEGNV